MTFAKCWSAALPCPIPLSLIVFLVFILLFHGFSFLIFHEPFLESISVIFSPSPFSFLPLLLSLSISRPFFHSFLCLIFQPLFLSLNEPFSPFTPPWWRFWLNSLSPAELNQWLCEDVCSVAVLLCLSLAFQLLWEGCSCHSGAFFQHFFLLVALPVPIQSDLDWIIHCLGIVRERPGSNGRPVFVSSCNWCI